MYKSEYSDIDKSLLELLTGGCLGQRVTRNAVKGDGSPPETLLSAESKLNFVASLQDLKGRENNGNHISSNSRAVSVMVLYAPGHQTVVQKGSVNSLSQQESMVGSALYSPCHAFSLWEKHLRLLSPMSHHTLS